MGRRRDVAELSQAGIAPRIITSIRSEEFRDLPLEWPPLTIVTPGYEYSAKWLVTSSVTVADQAQAMARPQNLIQNDLIIGLSAHWIRQAAHWISQAGLPLPCSLATRSAITRFPVP